MNDMMAAFRADLEGFDEATRDFYTGKMSKQEYKGISGGFGSYSEKGGQKGMIRLRMTAGRLTKEKLAFVVETTERLNVDLIKLTTCETVQLHHLTGRQILDVAEKALDAGIVCRGGGGDHPRNVMAPPLSGVLPGESFDVIPYAELVADYLLSLLYDIHMPRKLKVGFANHTSNVAHVTMRDLGFVAEADGCFSVYIAGGMGPNPRMGLKVAEHVPGGELLYYVKAMVDTFLAHGNYEQRAKARTRYMQEALGEEGLRQAYNQALEGCEGRRWTGPSGGSASGDQEGRGQHQRQADRCPEAGGLVRGELPSPGRHAKPPDPAGAAGYHPAHGAGGGAPGGGRHHVCDQLHRC